MRKSRLYKITIFLIILTLIIICADTSKKNNRIEIYKNKTEIIDIFNKRKEIDLDFDQDDVHVSIDILKGGYDIFTCNGYGYRYGPSIIYYEDGSLDLWIASQGNNSTEWDYIRYIHSDDGLNWTDEEIVLKPTKKSLDHYSTCDPGVIYFNGYYYLGYTSTTDSKGYDNNIFVARSENPNGPFEKWDGEGWGGDPVPIIEFDEPSNYWGAGEISFCIKDETLYCYYSWHGSQGAQTKVSTAELTENWPATLQYQGIAFNKMYGDDSCDIAYVEKYDRFIALAVAKRLSADCSVIVYESSDGLTFKKVEKVDDNFIEYSHNLGISKRCDGSLGMEDDLYIGYAYGQSWGKWSAYFQPIELDVFIEK